MLTRMASCPPPSLLPTRFVQERENKNAPASIKQTYMQTPESYEFLEHTGHREGVVTFTSTCEKVVNN